MLRDLVLAPVLVQKCHLHALEIKMQALSSQQAFLETIPVAKLDVVGRSQSALEAEGFFGTFGDIVGQLIALEVER